MDPLTEDEVEVAWLQANSGEEDEVAAAAVRFQEEQPHLLHYLLEIGNERLEPEAAELLLFLGTVLWQIMSRVPGGDWKTVEEVTEKRIVRMENDSAVVRKHLQGDAMAKLSFEDRYEDLFESHVGTWNQEILLTFATEAIIDAHSEKDPELDDDDFAWILFSVKVLVDALDW